MIKPDSPSDHRFNRLIISAVLVFIILTMLFGLSLLVRLIDVYTRAATVIQENVDVLQETTSELQISVDEFSTTTSNTEINSNLEEINETLEEVVEVLEETSLVGQGMDGVAESRQFHDEFFTGIAWLAGLSSITIALLSGAIMLIWRKRVRRLELNKYGNHSHTY